MIVVGIYPKSFVNISLKSNTHCKSHLRIQATLYSHVHVCNVAAHAREIDDRSPYFDYRCFAPVLVVKFPSPQCQGKSFNSQRR